MRQKICLIIVSFFLVNNFASAEVLSGELENPAFDPLYWLSPPIDCVLAKTEAEKRYGKIDSQLLKSEFDAVASDFCLLAKDCKISFCSNIKEYSKNFEKVIQSQAQKVVTEAVVSTKVVEQIDPQMQLRADLEVLFKERTLLWKENIEKAIRNEENFDLAWQKIEMPFFDRGQSQVPTKGSLPFQEKQLIQQRGMQTPQENKVFLDSAPKKDKYFNILKN